MSEQRSRLGKGLDDLLGAEDPAPDDAGLTRIPVEDITPNPHQPRDRFDPDKLEELTDSIRQQGVVEPLLVRPLPDGETPYQLVAGERRWRAATQAGLDRVPAVVRKLAPDQALVLSLVENIQRENLNPLEEARAYRRLLDQQGLNQGELARSLGKSRSAVANRLRLLRLPEAVQTALHEGRLSAGHARALLALDGERAMVACFERVQKEELTVRETERLVADFDGDEEDTSSTETRSTTPRDDAGPHVRDLEARLEEAVGAPVRIDTEDRREGDIIIHFNSPDEFERLQQRLQRLDDV